MKPAALLLTASLVANAALVGYVVFKSPAPSALAPAAAASSTSPRTTAGASGSIDALRAALASGDAAALEAAGLSREQARELAVGRTFARLIQRMHAAQQQKADGRWWRNRPAVSREEQLQLRREMTEALVGAFGSDLGLFGAGAGAQLDFLPTEKRDALRRITQDYDEMMAKFSASGIQLPSDREKLKLLRAERDRDIAALLSPSELAEYEMRTSPAAASVRSRYGDAIESEDDFRKIYALQKAFEEKFPRDGFTGRITPEQMQQRSAAERQLQDELRVALGDDKYAALRRASDGDLRNVDSLAQRLGLAADTTSQVAAARQSFAAESLRINSDTSLSPPERRAQLQSLASRAKTELARTLGAEAADAYAQRSPWVSMLQNGMAYSTDPKDSPSGGIGLGSQSVFVVPPVGAAGAAPVRQAVSIVSDGMATGAAPAGGTFFFGADPTVRQVETQMISVTSGAPVMRSTTVPAAGAAAATGNATAPAPKP